MKAREATSKFGDKKLVVVTGTSSGLGRNTARALLRTGKCAPAAFRRSATACAQHVRSLVAGTT